MTYPNSYAPTPPTNSPQPSSPPTVPPAQQWEADPSNAGRLNPAPHPQPDREQRLGYLFAEFDRLKPAYDALKKEFDAVKDAIKYEATTAHPGERKIRIEHPNLSRPLEVFYSEREIIDSKRLEAEKPEIAREYTKTSSSWTITWAKS